MKKKALKWLLYVVILVLLTAIAGDFGTLAGVALIFMLQ